ncbi:MAG: response regulator [Deltaproteobacteria bacterium]|nr:response regulator [Deltaproteobacteria bacterium]
MGEVLVVDPGELGDLLAALFEQYGLHAARARTGVEALERALELRPRVVVLEHDLPDATGEEVGELLRAELGATVVVTYPQSLPADDEAAMTRIATMDASFSRPFRSLTLIETAARLAGLSLHKGEGGSEAPNMPLASGEGAVVEDDDDELLLDVEVAAAEADPSDEAARAADPGIAQPIAAPGTAAGAPAPEAKRAYSPGALADLWARVKERRAAPAPVPEARGELPLSPRGYADMLDAFAQSQTTGELWVTNGRARRVLLLRRGSVVGARSNLESEDLSTLAHKKALISADDIALVRDDVLQGRRKTVAEAILARGLLAEPELRKLIEEHTRRVAIASFAWPSGTMRVTLEGRATREVVPVQVTVADVILRGILLTESDAALLAAAPDDARFSPSGDAGYGLQDLPLSAEEARVVVAMDGTKTVGDLVTLFDTVPARTVRGLTAALLCLDLVRFVGWGHASARRISYF